MFFKKKGKEKGKGKGRGRWRDHNNWASNAYGDPHCC